MEWLVTMTVWICLLSDYLLFPYPEDTGDFVHPDLFGQALEILRGGDLEYWVLA
jgi:hypothetical protein